MRPTIKPPATGWLLLDSSDTTPNPQTEIPVFFRMPDPALAQRRAKSFSFRLIFSSVMASNARVFFGSPALWSSNGGSGCRDGFEKWGGLGMDFVVEMDGMDGLGGVGC